MSERRETPKRPRDYLAYEQAWPDGDLIEGAPPQARLAQALVRRLREACADRSVNDVARNADLSRATVYNLLSGTRWATIATVASLEVTLGVRLWGNEHRDLVAPHGYVAPARSDPTGGYAGWWGCRPDPGFSGVGL